MNRIYPIHSISSAKAYEESVLQGDAGRTSVAMEQAGRAIGNAILKDFRELREWPETPRLLLLAGKGLNAGDAFVACEVLHKALPGLIVTMVETAPRDSLNPMAREILDRLVSTMGDQLEPVSIEACLAADPVPLEVVLDGIYGLGFRPPLPELVGKLLARVNQRRDIDLRVAIDLPSGMGEESDPNSFVADFTYIPGVAKEPCFRANNQDKTGRIRFLEIPPFLDQPAPETQVGFVSSRHAFKQRNRLRPARSDKRDFGHCLIVAGSSQMPGAALMSAMGALQAGAGLVTVFSPMSVATLIASAVPEAMWRPLHMNPEGGLDVESVRQVSLLAGKAQVLLIGPGLQIDRGTVFTLCRMIREVHLPLVIDASALTRDIVSATLGRPASAGPVVLTPHAGEFARLHGQGEAHDLTDLLLNFSLKFRSTVILKGSPTRISDGRKIISAPVGGPVLARGGTGDILSGMLCALLAQNPADPLGAAVDAVTWHGAAADSLARQNGGIAVRTTELLPHLAATLRA